MTQTTVCVKNGGRHKIRLLDIQHPGTCQSYQDRIIREGDSGISDVLNIFCDRIFRLSNEDSNKNAIAGGISGNLLPSHLGKRQGEV